jgi:hypothetical protein
MLASVPNQFIYSITWLFNIIHTNNCVGQKYNAKHRQTKEPLNFFVDLEPGDNNKEVYKTKLLKSNHSINLTILSSAHDVNYMALPVCQMLRTAQLNNLQKE